MNLYEKIAEVATKLKTIEKDMTVGNEKYGYKAVSDLSVTKAVKEAEKEFKIVSIPYNQEIVHHEILKKVSGSGESYVYSFIIKMTTKIINLEKPDEVIEIVSFGHGLDSGDKGFGKASTYARKYALLNAYKIATGEDPDKEPSKEEQAPKTPSEKRIAIENYYNKDVQKLQNFLKHFNIGVIEDLSEKDVLTVYKTLKEKKVL
jgi:hypothetical protein